MDKPNEEWSLGCGQHARKKAPGAYKHGNAGLPPLEAKAMYLEDDDVNDRIGIYLPEHDNEIFAKLLLDFVLPMLAPWILKLHQLIRCYKCGQMASYF